MSSKDKELDILQRITQLGGGIRQRDLARSIGLSLGMTNAIVRRLAQKGWLKVRKVNNRNIQYIVSAEGLDAIARRSYQYFRRTIRNVIRYKEAIDELLVMVSKQGYRKVVLVGKSDLDFIVEQLCSKRRLGFEKSEACELKDSDSDATFWLHSERSRLRGCSDNQAGLQSIITDRIEDQVHPS